MTFTGIGVAAGAICAIVALIAAAVVSVVLRRRQRTSKPRQRVDPDRDARDADRRRQQLLLALLSRTISPRVVGDWRWSPRLSNPTTKRATLTFDSWRPVRADGTRRHRRHGPEALVVGDQWPFILAVDLVGMPSEDASSVATEIAQRVGENAGTRVRLLTGAEGAGRLRSAVEAGLEGAGIAWTARVDALDIASLEAESPG